MNENRYYYSETTVGHLLKYKDVKYLSSLLKKKYEREIPVAMFQAFDSVNAILINLDSNSFEFKLSSQYLSNTQLLCSTIDC